METHKYRNKAFLSYRHVKEDEKIAALLQRVLENYHVPKTIRSDSHGVGRIFRDTTDLGARADLTEELRRELEDSEYLIVLCSEKTAESRWVAREISVFLQSHTADRILPVITEGDPSRVLEEVFGKFEEMSRHPLACDLRESRERGLFKRRFTRDEISRLAAALLDCPFDELINRRRRYESRRTALVIAGAFLLLTAVASYYAYTSSRIRKSYRDRQIAESKSLAVQSETALGQRFRFDAIRYALDALPAQKEDRPVTGQAVLALQKAVAAYIPEGSRKTAQTAEYQVPGRIIDYQVHYFGETTYLSVIYGDHELVLWNTETGDVVYDSRTFPSLQIDNEAEEEVYSTHAFKQDRLYFTKKNHLTAIDIGTGEQLWQMDEEPEIRMQILDVKEDAILLLAFGVRKNRPLSAETEGSDINGMPLSEEVQELQLRSTDDGSLFYCRKTNLQPDQSRNVYVENALFSGIGNRVLFLENTNEVEEDPEKHIEGDDSGIQSSLCLLDPLTGQEQFLIQAKRICDYRITDNHQVLTVTAESINGVDELESDNVDSSSVRYSSAQTGQFTVRGTDLETGKTKWTTKSGNTQDYHVRLDSDLQINGEKTCLLSSGTHMDILDQESGEILYEIDYPGLPISWKKEENSGLEELEAVLENGSKANFQFSSAKILKENGVFPEAIAEVKEADGDLYILCAQEGETASSDRLYVFGKEVYDPETAAIRSSSGVQLNMETSQVEYGFSGIVYGYTGYTKEGTVADDLFIQTWNKPGSWVVSGTDACTGENVWETELGVNTEYAGYASDPGIMVFRDHILSGRELVERSARGEPAPQEEWNLLHINDGHVDTVQGIEKVFGEDPVWVMSSAVSKDSLILSLNVGGEVWLLRYPLTGGDTQTIHIPQELLEIVSNANIPNQIVSSPDGNSTICDFYISDYTETGDYEHKWINLLINWKKEKITELTGTPPVGLYNPPLWNPDNSGIAFLGLDGDVFLISPDGKVIYERPASREKTMGIVFWKGELFTVDQVGFDIHLRMPQRGIDILLPAGKRVRYEQRFKSQEVLFAWELPGSKMLLKYGSQSFILDPETGIIESVINYLVNYNPQSDTMILLDNDKNLAAVPRYEWEQLAEKGRKELQKLRILEP